MEFTKEELVLLKHAFSAMHTNAYYYGNVRLKDLERVVDMLAEKTGSEKKDYSKLRDK